MAFLPNENVANESVVKNKKVNVKEFPNESIGNVFVGKGNT